MQKAPLSSILAAGLLASMGAQAALTTPDSVTATINVGETIKISKTITLDASGAGRVDLFFLADNTGSMIGVIDNVKSVAGTLLSNLNGIYSDAAFGVGRYLGDPIEGVAPTTGFPSRLPYLSSKSLLHPKPVLDRKRARGRKQGA